MPADAEIYRGNDNSFFGYAIINGERFNYREVDWDPAKEKAAMIAANKHGGEWDFPLLAEGLLELDHLNFDMDLTGFDSKEIENIMTHLPQDLTAGLTDPDDVPETPKETRYKRGDLILLDKHRLLCGDSTMSDEVERLMGGEEANMVFTDPPYGIDIVSRGGTDGAPGGMKSTHGESKSQIVQPRKYRPIIGDDKPFDPTPFLTLAPKVFLWGANCYASKLPDQSHWIVWDKKCEKGADRNSFSDCELAWTNIERKSVVIYRHIWAGVFRAGKRNEELSKRVHPTQKPVGLFIQILSDYTRQNEIVLDPFLGSGSTIIACEKIGRSCFGMEIDPYYCQVIVDRWEKFTGKKAELCH